MGITDVGLLAPGPGAQAFFGACRFGDDPEGSTPMVLLPSAAAGYRGGGRGGAYRRRPGLESAVRGLEELGD